MTDTPKEYDEAMYRFLETPASDPNSEKYRREYLEIAAKWRVEKSK